MACTNLWDICVLVKFPAQDEEQFLAKLHFTLLIHYISLPSYLLNAILFTTTFFVCKYRLRVLEIHGPFYSLTQ